MAQCCVAGQRKFCQRRLAAAPPCGGVAPLPYQGEQQGKEKPPLCKGGDSMATPCRGDCEAEGMIQLVFYCRVREHRLGVAARRSPPCAKGGQHGNAMQGGLTALNPRDDTRCRVWLSLARCRQSLSRRSPTAPFAQGSRLCCSAHNHPFLWRWARIAKQPLPGDGLSHPEHRGRAVHKAFSEFWERRLAA